MKTLIIISCLFGYGIANGQVRLKRDSLRKVVTHFDDSLNRRDLVVIQPHEMPITLRDNLEAIEYQGWRKGVIYRTKLADMFLVEIPTAEGVRAYRFDASGKPLDQ